MIETVEFKPFSARRVIALRDEKGMTREQLAVVAGIPYGTLTTIERATNEPKVNAVARIAAALEVPIGELFAQDGGE